MSLSIYRISNDPERFWRLLFLLSVLQVFSSRLKFMRAIGVYFHDPGFGRKISWRDDQVIPIGRRMTFKEALHIVSTDMGLRIIVPEWAMGLTQRLRKIRIAFEDFEVGNFFPPL